MPVKKLVSPERIVYHVESLEALDELAKSLKLGNSLKGNLKQLCGWAKVGNGRSDLNDRDVRHKVCNPALA